MGWFEVDTASLLAQGADLQALDEPLSQACVRLREVEHSRGAAGVPDVDGAIDEFVRAWGASVVALRAAAEGLGLGVEQAATAYETTDQSVIGP